MLAPPNDRLPSTWPWLLGAVLLALVACGDDDGGDPGGPDGGPTGADGGPVGTDGGPGSPSGWVDPEGQPASAPEPAPLPASAFVFVRQARPGVTHLYVHDTATGESRMLSALDDSTDHVRAALSPDRRLVAFAALFRPSITDLATGVPQPSIWLVSVDGLRYRRVSETVPIPDSGFECTSTVDDVCIVVGMQCNVSSRRCQYPSFRVTLGQPAWSADMQHLWAPFGQAWIDPTSGEPRGGSVLARVPVSGGPIELRDPPMDCRQASHSATHPSRDAVTAIHSICGSGQASVHIVEIDPATGTERTLVDQMGVEPELLPPAWFPDGSGLLFVASANWDLDRDGSGETYGTGVMAFEAASGQIGPLLPPLASGLSYASLAVAPDNARVAICVRNDAAGTSSLVLLDPSNMAEPVRPLIDDGASCYASW